MCEELDERNNKARATLELACEIAGQSRDTLEHVHNQITEAIYQLNPDADMSVMDVAVDNDDDAGDEAEL